MGKHPFQLSSKLLIHNACWEGGPRFQFHLATDASKPPTKVFFSSTPLNQCVCFLVFIIPLHAARRAMAVALPLPKQRRRASTNDHILSRTGLAGPSRAPLSPPPNSPLNQSEREFATSRDRNADCAPLWNGMALGHGVSGRTRFNLFSPTTMVISWRISQRRLIGAHYRPLRMRDAVEFCRPCSSCQFFGPRKLSQTVLPMLHLQSMDMLGMDYLSLISQEPKSRNRYILVMVD